MSDQMTDYNKVVKLDKVRTEKENTMDEVFNAGQEMIAMYRRYATEELAGNIESILMDYLRGENTNSDSGNLSLQIAYQMFPEKKSRSQH
uniref:Transcriptional regulator n=1 Tax=Rhabditophanes sp. KR3021 TaxID=114890 RepID=A0AC35TUE7_9BILA